MRSAPLPRQYPRKTWALASGFLAGNPVALVTIASVVVFLLMSLAAARWSFPSPVDELQHLSVIAEQSERPGLFRDPAEYRVLSSDLANWSSQRNYINHPSLYYLALAPVWELTGSVRLLRLVNTALALAALLLVLAAGFRLFRSPSERCVFAVLAASFPKAAVVAGMINNDNLAALAGAAVFAGVAGLAGAPWWMAAGLALAGWTKLTALIALGTVVACYQGWRLLRGEKRAWTSETAIIAAGAIVGAVPYLVNLARSGRLLWFNSAHFQVPAELRIELGFAAYVGDFLLRLLNKWPALEYGLPAGLLLCILAALMILIASGLSRACPATTPAAAPYMLAFGATLLLQIGFGWTIYREIGDLTIAQTRYYNVLWPGFAVAGTAGAMRLARDWPRASIWLVSACLLPTLLGMPLLLTLSGKI